MITSAKPTTRSPLETWLALPAALLALSLVTALAIGCGKDSGSKDEAAGPPPTEQPIDEPSGGVGDEAPTEPAAIAADGGAAAAADTAADPADEIPTPEDYEQEANTEITADNLEDELAAIESELGE